MVSHNITRWWYGTLKRVNWGIPRFLVRKRSIFLMDVMGMSHVCFINCSKSLHFGNKIFLSNLNNSTGKHNGVISHCLPSIYATLTYMSESHWYIKISQSHSPVQFLQQFSYHVISLLLKVLPVKNTSSFKMDFFDLFTNNDKHDMKIRRYAWLCKRRLLRV